MMTDWNDQHPSPTGLNGPTIPYFGKPSSPDRWTKVLRALGGVTRLLIACGVVMVCLFMVWWLWVLIQAAARGVERYWG